LSLVGLHGFLTLYGNEAGFLAFFQTLEAVALDRAEVHERIRADIRGDKAKTYLVVKLLDRTALTIRHVLYP